MILFLLIILTIVALAHVINTDYEQAIESDKDTNNKTLEPLVTSDSDYSACEVGCIIACSNKEGVLQNECYCPCVDQCWNY